MKNPCLNCGTIQCSEGYECKKGIKYYYKGKELKSKLKQFNDTTLTSDKIKQLVSVEEVEEELTNIQHKLISECQVKINKSYELELKLLHTYELLNRWINVYNNKHILDKTLQKETLEVLTKNE